VEHPVAHHHERQRPSAALLPAAGLTIVAWNRDFVGTVRRVKAGVDASGEFGIPFQHAIEPAVELGQR
jgi:hypothetical protein